jgi:chromosome segregation ATPase
MSVTPTAFTHTLGTDLERDRLERRVSRMTFAIASLRQRASEYRRELSSPPRQLRQIIADFEAQIEEINARLHDLAREPASAQFQPRTRSHDNRH